MRQNKLSPGPWKAIDMRPDPRLDGVVINAKNSIDVFDSELEVVAMVNPSKEYDARLIANAPEMLDKLEVALRRLKEKSDDSSRDLGLIQGIEQLIKRVEGEQP